MSDKQALRRWLQDLIRPVREGFKVQPDPSFGEGARSVLDKPLDRRKALGALTTAVAAGSTLLQTSCTLNSDPLAQESAGLKWEEFFKKNYRLMTDEERQTTIERLTRLAELETGSKVHIGREEASEGVLFGYAFNISKCKGYMDCVKACVQENNLDRETQYIRIFEIENGQTGFGAADSNFYHEVPAEGHYYLGTQCFHCEHPPCVNVCPVGATWKEPDGIVVVDYDWCIGCRYCEAACPYLGRRFNWHEPQIPTDEINPEQHYLGNRPRKKGVMEKCTFCVQRTRKGLLPACVEACPTGARIFGNLLDPNSEIRYVLANKNVFRLKEELGTEPKFWYFSD